MNQRMPRQIVSLPGQEVGELRRNKSGLVRWQPNAEWESRDQRPRLGISFLRQPGPRQAGTGLLPWFENVLPEQGSALRQRLCAAHGLRESDGWRLLGKIGRDLSGAAEVRPSDASPEAGSSPFYDNSRSGEPDLSGQLRFSLAGMQLKLSMSMAGERMVLDAKGGGGRWIVKLPGTHYTQLPEVESATMTWAKNAGFEVPTHFTISTEKLSGVPSDWLDDIPSAFAIQRFDRRDDGSKVHQEDLCQCLDLPPWYKYGDVRPQRVTLDGALRLVRDVAGEEHAREMARRIGFVIASGNDDAHLKNWSLLWGNADRPGLTPCYDFVATISWNSRHGWDAPTPPTLALDLGGEKLFSRLTRSVLDRFAEKSGCSWAPAEVTGGIERARDAWRSTEQTAPEILVEGVHKHWSRVPLLHGMLSPTVTLNRTPS